MCVLGVVKLRAPGMSNIPDFLSFWEAAWDYFGRNGSDQKRLTAGRCEFSEAVRRQRDCVPATGPGSLGRNVPGRTLDGGSSEPTRLGHEVDRKYLRLHHRPRCKSRTMKWTNHRSLVASRGLNDVLGKLQERQGFYGAQGVC